MKAALAAAAVSTALASPRPQPASDEPKAVAEYPHVPPARVSSNPNHPDFHPSFKRIGVLVDGQPRTDVFWYDAPGGRFRVIGDGAGGPVREGQVAVFWRWQESRQERRARERWDAKHGKGQP